MDEPQMVVFKGSYKLAAEPRGVPRSAALAAAEMVLVRLLTLCTVDLLSNRYTPSCRSYKRLQYDVAGRHPALQLGLVFVGGQSVCACRASLLPSY